jgi:hypothetical protein
VVADRAAGERAEIDAAYRQSVRALGRHPEQMSTVVNSKQRETTMAAIERIETRTSMVEMERR